MIDVIAEEMLPFSKVPSWHEKHFGNRIAPSTLHRWRLRGARGVKLESILIGGKRFTSVEALLRFFDETTAAEDGPSASPAPLTNLRAKHRESHEEAEAYLKSQGI